MKILLAYQSGLPNRDDPYISVVPTGLCYLHAILKEAGHDSTLANFSAWKTHAITKLLLKLKPSVIGISQWTHNRHSSIELAKICRRTLPECTIIMGGGHATFCYDDILCEDSPVDIVVRGEAEQTLLEIISGLSDRTKWSDIAGIAFRDNGTIITTKLRSRLDDLDLLPIPARYMDTSVGLDIEIQAEFIVTTRGCPSSCHFCSSPDFWGKKVRFRSPGAILEEVRYIKETYGLIYFSFRDDTFTADRKRVLEFCQLLQQTKTYILWNCQSRVTAIDQELLVEMKRAGCECIQLGVESGSPEILSRLGKNITPEQIKLSSRLIRETGINLSIYLISAIPGEISADTEQTLNLIKDIQPDDGYVSPLAYYPGTRMYNDALKSGTITHNIFAETGEAALYALHRPGKSTSKLLKELTKHGQQNADRFQQQKSRLGFCFTSNVITAEWYRQHGNYRGAENELLEISDKQPENPWGWFLLGDLYYEEGKISQGKAFYQKVLNIIPCHRPSREALSAE